jgi:peptidoglycan/xylan/chitin deacetylase (PgdA/CDA1 family)
MSGIDARLGAWLPSRFLKGSALFQLAGWPLALWASPAAPWLTEALVLNHVLITAASVWPQSRLLGPNLVRLPEARARRGEIALTFDDGPDPEITPKVLDLLESRGVAASFFCIAERAARHPELVRAIHSRGHGVENHSYGHRWNFALQGVAAIRDDIRRAQDTLAELAGRAPAYFRAPFGIRNPWVQPLLEPLGLSLVSWSRRGYDGVLGNSSVVERRLLRGLKGGDIVLLHDGDCARGPNGRPVVLEVLPRLLDEIERLGLQVRPLSHAASAEPAAVGN